jgi:cytochrome P450
MGSHRDGRKEHTRHRALISSIFTAKAIDAPQPVIESLAHGRLDAFAAAGRADLVTDLTTVFPVQVIAHIVGVPPGDYARFMRWSLDLIAFSKDPQRGRQASATLRLPPADRAAPRRPCGDVISKLVTGAVDGVGLTDDG